MINVIYNTFQMYIDYFVINSHYEKNYIQDICEDLFSNVAGLHCVTEKVNLINAAVKKANKKR